MGEIIFKINKPTIYAQNLAIEFSYELAEYSFRERVEFSSGLNMEIFNLAIFSDMLKLSALILGVSYYKLLAPFKIKAPFFSLSESERKFTLAIYENGLGEFFARNNLKRFGKIELISAKNNEFLKCENANIKLHDRILLPIGGGKDSLVSAQILQKANIDFTPIAINPKGPIISSIKKIGKEPIYIKRILDKKMIELAKRKQFYNGHVPSTAINSVIIALCALLYDYKYIAFSNERSANEGNIIFDGREANHQYSKSLQFEKIMQNILAKITNGELEYFSLLRPFSEAKIGQIFALENKFDKDFSSCNQNFKLSGHGGSLWCNNCPKCHFTFLILAPNMAKKRLINIFGKNLLAEKKNISSFRQLTGLNGHKPWECVGEILEGAAILYSLGKNSDWSDDFIVANLYSDLVNFYGAKKLQTALSELMKNSNIHLIPARIEKVVMPYAQ